MVSKKVPPPPDFDDDAPILTAAEIKELRPAREMFEELGIPMPVPRGRPKSEVTKEAVTLRLDPDVLDFYRAGGPGWQTRINAALRGTLPKKRA